MSNAPQQNADPFQSMRGNFNIALFIIRSWSTSIEVFFRRDFGDRYLGWQAVAVLILVPLYSLGWRGYDLRWLGWFIPAYCARCLFVRAMALPKRLRGEYWHSYYNGRPSAWKPNGKVSERMFKRILEPGMTFALGATMRHFGEAPLGTYLMIGGACVFISFYLCETTERIRLMNMHDAVIEQELTAERFRQMRGDL